MYLKKIISVVVAGIFLTGCSNIPKLTPDMPKQEELMERAVQDWVEPPVTTEGKSMLVLITPETPPQSVLSKRITLELEQGATVKDLVAILAKKLGQSIILADKEAGDKEFWLPAFNGTLGSLLSAITKVTDVFFLWHDGTMLVSSTETVTVGVPQEEKLIEKIAGGLKDLGAETVQSSFEAGTISFNIRPSQVKHMKKFLERVTRNSALVTLQVAVVTVSLNRDTKTGVDWNKLNVAAGSRAKELMLPVPVGSTVTGVAGATTGNTNTPVTGGGTTTTAGGAVATATGTVTTDNLKNFVQFTSNTLKGGIYTSAFSLTGLINFLDTYGTSDTLQNVIVKTVTGNELEFKTVTQIPYVSGVGVTTTGVAQPATVGQQVNNSVLGSAKTEKANDGVTLKFKPYYDAGADTVTINMNLAIESVLSFNELSAGNQIGSLTQPTTAERSFNDILILRPGQTAVVGGIMFDSVSDSRAGLPGTWDKTAASSAVTVKRYEMFIIVRPTVMTLGSLEEQQGDPEILQARDKDDSLRKYIKPPTVLLDKSKVKAEPASNPKDSKGLQPEQTPNPSTPARPSQGTPPDQVASPTGLLAPVRLGDLEFSPLGDN